MVPHVRDTKKPYVFWQYDIFRDIEELQVDCFNIEELFDPDTTSSKHLACLVSEIGELAEVYRQQDIRKRPYNFKNRLGEEIADVIITATICAMQGNVDVRDCIRKKIAKIRRRIKSGSKRYGKLTVDIMKKDAS